MTDAVFDRAEEVGRAVRKGAGIRVGITKTWTREQLADACRANDVMLEDLLARFLLEGGTIDIVPASNEHGNL